MIFLYIYITMIPPFLDCFSHGNFHVDSISLLPLSHPWIGPSPASRIAPAQSIPWTPVRLRTAVYHNKNPVGYELQHFCFIKVSCQIFFTHYQEVRASQVPFFTFHHLHPEKKAQKTCRPGTVNFPRPKKLVKVSMTCEFSRKGSVQVPLASQEARVHPSLSHSSGRLGNSIIQQSSSV